MLNISRDIYGGPKGSSWVGGRGQLKGSYGPEVSNLWLIKLFRLGTAVAQLPAEFSQQ